MILTEPNPNPSRITDEMWWLWLELKKLEPTTQLGGIYAYKAGYHNTRNNLLAKVEWRTDYSVQLAADKEGPSDKSAALDWTFPDAQAGSYARIAKYGSRLLTSGRDMNDPRGNVLREAYFQADSDLSVEGWDFFYVRAATSDSSHLWHIHFSFLRKYVNDLSAMRAVLSILKGETVEQWRASEAGATEVENEMMLVKEVDRPEVYLADGFTYKHLSPEQLLRIQSVWNAQGKASNVINVPSGHVRAGYLGDPLIPHATVDQIADAVVAKLPASDGRTLTVDDVKLAVKNALREGTL